MTDRAQFEAMLEALINEDQEAAKEIFHNIVVGKSREIYEELLESDFGVIDESDKDDDDDEDDAEQELANPFTSDEDESDDDESDEDDEDEDDEDESDDDLENRVLDLEEALEELKAEFDELLAGEENEQEHTDMFNDEEDEFGGELSDDDSEIKEIHHFHHDGDDSDAEFNQFMEYVNKVALPKHGESGVQTKSAVASKNDMGGTAANIAQSRAASKGGTQGGLLNPTTKPQTGGNVNVPGAKSATKLKPVSKVSSEKSANSKSIVGGK